MEANEEGELTEDSHIQITQIPQAQTRAFRDGREFGVQPLALVTWQDSTPLSVFPVVHHNLNYARTNPAEGEGATRHFFWAV